MSIRDVASRFSLQRAAFYGVFVACVGVLLTSGPRSVSAYAATPTPEWLVAIDSDDPPTVMWDLLAELDLRTGEASDSLSQFVGKMVRVPGFMVPLEDWAGEASEFLLVPYVGACVHSPPPPPNQLVYVEMENQRSVEVSFWDPVWIHGTLVVEQTESVLASLKPDAILVNAARGFIASAADLRTWLDANADARLICDVHDPEPVPESHPLLHHDRALLVPHLGAGTRPAKTRMGRVVEDVWRVLRGEQPTWPAP